MLKAVAQTPPQRRIIRLRVLMAAVAAATALSFGVGVAFGLFLVIVEAAGGVGALPAALAWRSGRHRLAGTLLLVCGVLFCLVGVAAFAPQPLWVGGTLIAIGSVGFAVEDAVSRE